MIDKIKKIVRSIGETKNSLFIKNKQKPIKNILIMYFNKEENRCIGVGDFDIAISNIKEDYDFTWVNQANKITTLEDLMYYDFIFIVDCWGGVVDRHLRSLKKNNIPRGILVSGPNIPCNKSKINFYNVIWYRTYSYGDLLPKHNNKVHAFGIDIESTKNSNDILNIENESQMLRARVRCNELTFDISNKPLMELLKSPIWDCRYYGNQIRYGIQFLYDEKVRATQLIKPSPKLKVGRHSFYSSNFVISGDEFVEVGSFCSLGKNISIYTSNHDVNYPSTQGYIYRRYFRKRHPGEAKLIASRSRTKGPVIIKNDVWIGDDVKIMSGVTIGNGVCIGAGSIVTKNVKDYEIIGGVPARHIRMRFENNDVIDFLLKIEWWNWSDKRIIKNEDFFLLNLNETNDFELNRIIK